MKKLLVLFGMLDLLIVLSSYERISIFILGASDINLKSIITLSLLLSLLISGYFLIRQKKIGLWMSYIQFLIRVYLAAFSFGFILVVFQSIDVEISSYTMFAAIMMLIEIARLYLTIRIHMRFFSVARQSDSHSSDSLDHALGEQPGGTNQQPKANGKGTNHTSRTGKGFRIAGIVFVALFVFVAGLAVLFSHIGGLRKPDLVINDFHVDKLRSNQLKFSIDIKNIGNDTIALEGLDNKPWYGKNIDGQVFFSKDTICDNADDIPSSAFQIDHGNQKTLIPGLSLDGDLTIDVPKDIDEWKYLVLKIDINDHIDESNEENNIAYVMRLSSVQEAELDNILKEKEWINTMEVRKEIAESSQKSVDTTTVAFNLSERPYEISYVKEDQLYFYDLASGEKLMFPDSVKFFNFAFSDDKRTLYYTVRENDSLSCRRATIGTNQVTIAKLGKLYKEASGFINWATGEKASLYVSDDTLGIQYGYGEHYGFRTTLFYAIRPNNIHEVPNSTIYNNASLGNKKQRQRNDDFRKKVIAIKSEGTTDLFLKTTDDTIRLSDFKQLKKNYKGTIDIAGDIAEHLEGMLTRSVGISPDSSKLLFTYPMVFYDLVHGPTCIVSLEGKNQKIIINDGSASALKPVWLPDGNNVLFIGRSENTKNTYDTNLCMTVNEKNDIQLIDEHVDYFVLR